MGHSCALALGTIRGEVQHWMGSCGSNSRCEGTLGTVLA